MVEGSGGREEGGVPRQLCGADSSVLQTPRIVGQSHRLGRL